MTFEGIAKKKIQIKKHYRVLEGFYESSSQMHGM